MTVASATLAGELAVPCALCEGATRRLFEKHGCWIRGCAECQHRQAELSVGSGHVGTVYDDSYFFGGGAGYSDYLSEAEIIRAHGRRYAERLARYIPPGRVLDVGAAAGFFLQGLVDGGWTGVGVEPNDRVAAYGRTELGLDVRTGQLEDLDTEERFDLVSIVQVMAHFVDPRAAMRRAAALTRPGGAILVETWNHRSPSARLFGRHWHEYSPPSVLHWFTRKGVCDLGGEFGFQEVAHGRPLKWIEVGHARSLLVHAMGEGAAARVVDRVLGSIPGQMALPYPSDDLFWTLLRRSD